MFNFKTLKCHHCSAVIFNLPEALANKLEGHAFVCDCCNHTNFLSNLMFIKSAACHTTYLFDTL
ncbi:MAG: hypothetical protein N2484_04780 [Clostridia bacterium]|nr:hypothetical protein [Clostridia bacterium]